MSSWIKFLRMLVTTRWPRYLMAGVCIFAAVASVVGALAAREMKQVSGTIASVTRTTDSQSDDYKFDAVLLAGSSQTYDVDVTQFSPSLSSGSLQPSTPVRFWYTQSPLGDPNVVALLFTASAAAAASTTAPQYLTDAYTHPEHLLTSNILFAGLCVVFAALAFAAGRFLPAPESDAKKKRKEAERTRSYGDLVVGPRQAPPPAP
jgi:hypothetical protein